MNLSRRLAAVALCIGALSTLAACAAEGDAEGAGTSDTSTPSASGAPSDASSTATPMESSAPDETADPDDETTAPGDETEAPDDGSDSENGGNTGQDVDAACTDVEAAVGVAGDALLELGSSGDPADAVDQLTAAADTLSAAVGDITNEQLAEVGERLSSSYDDLVQMVSDFAGGDAAALGEAQEPIADFQDALGDFVSLCSPS